MTESSSQRIAVISEEFDGQRLDQALASLFSEYSRARLQTWIKAGNITLDAAVVLPKTRVRAGQQVVFEVPEENRVEDVAEDLPLDVVYEDSAILVINKPAGLVVHPGAGNQAGTLMNGLLHRAPELKQVPRAGIIHRLDKDTTGLLLVARSLEAHFTLVQALEKREIRREYRAVCNDRLTAGESIESPIARHPSQRTRMAVVQNGKPAVTHFRVLARFAQHTFVAVRLETGRTHQIRVHFAYRRHPLVGDPVYGGRLKIPEGASEELTGVMRAFRRQALHASDLGFTHPVTGEEMHFHAPLPDDLLGLLNALAGKAEADFEAMQWP